MPAPDPVADVIVVGGGSSGCVVAARLSANPDRAVLLIEAGPGSGDPGPLGLLPVGPRSDVAATYPVELLPGHSTTIARGRVLGGSGAVNGGYFIRGTASDFRSWPATWSYSEVLPYFRKLETDRAGNSRWHGDDGPMPVTRIGRESMHPVSSAFLDACATEGFGYAADLNAPNADGAGPVPLNAVAGRRISTAAAYLEPILGRPNLRVRTGVVARRVVFDGVRAVGVEAEIAGELRLLPARQVVLCAGAIGTAHLLMHSGIGSAQHLSGLGLPVVADRPGVGRDFGDHPEVTLAYRPRLRVPRNEHTAVLEAVLEVDGIEIRPYTAPFAEIIPGVADPDPRLGVALMRPDSRGELTLRSSDPADPPVVRYRYLASAADRAAMRSGLDLARGLLASAAFGRVAAGAGPSPSETFENLGTSMHLSGTCRMGSEADRDAVVDDRCRVIGVDEVLVADTSVMPVVTSRGPHATAVMIAERVSALIEGDASPAHDAQGSGRV
ncbi:mycofactocin dehydrogenase MftG [Rhodococcus maanshanensis]|uniref:Choline dehydrogenase n=1 Tax=Rhodococcus maanshanensis TaxID=183556 RepID=A0A1H7JY15_9NOCA|nr:mycofactocin system GMC family oxidoreductase MftG [Rhodococcus maanshanensis]SEK79372.1 choline dehydrogenase [Rhodococcus maanshanensis]